MKDTVVVKDKFPMYKWDKRAKTEWVRKHLLNFTFSDAAIVGDFSHVDAQCMEECFQGGPRVVLIVQT